jgi:NADPH:quinone reductase
MDPRVSLSRALYLPELSREEPLFPAQLGYDAAGVVKALGPEVTTLKVGDQVSTLPATSLLDYTAHGETLVYPETVLLVYPDSLTPVQAAAVNTGLFTAYFALLELACLKPHQYVVITAATSSMGVAAIQLAKGMGAKTIAVTQRPRKTSCGASERITSSLQAVMMFNGRFSS